MKILIVGSGKLANELLASLRMDSGCEVVSWSDHVPGSYASIVVHAGSGKALTEVVSYCRLTNAVLVELATGSALCAREPGFPIVLCPNTNILMLKFMHMLAGSGPLFREYEITLTESHQAGKTSTPGTAAGLATSLGVDSADIRSIRDTETQTVTLQIPHEHLERHAFHRIRIADGLCSLSFESRVYGDAPYADGVARILAAIRAHTLENRVYDIDEFIQNGWI